jgi:AraC-like DNA-binding protein
MRQYGTNEVFDAGFRNSDVFTLKIQKRWADDFGCNLTGDIGDSLKMATLVSSRDGYGASLLRLIMYSWRELSGNLKHPAAIKQVEENLVTLFWLAFTADDNTAARETSSVPKYLRRAEEFIAANLTDPPTLPEIVRVADVSASTLTRSFLKKYAVSPIAFMKQRRLEMVRGQLLTPRDQGKTVTAIAMEYGFYQLGQFAVDYRKMFGESPSDNLRHN